MEIVNDKLPEIKNIIENVQEKVHTAMNKLEKDLENIEKVLDSYDIKLETRKTNGKKEG